MPAARGRDPRARGRAVQRQLDAAAAHDPVREARPHAGEEDEDRRRRPTPTRCRRWPTSTRSSRRCSATARSRSCGTPTPTRCRRSCRPTAASTRRSTSSPRRRAASRRKRRTCRTCRCARRTGASCARRSSPTTVAGSSRPTTRRSSCASWRTSPRIPVSSKRSSAAPTSTPPPRRAVFDVDEEKVDDFQRRFAKVVNYGLAYGMEAYGLAQRLDIPTDQAREILDAYFAAFPNIAAYMTRDGARGQGVRVHDHAVRPAPSAAGAVVRQLPHPPDGGAHGAERAGAGERGRHLQARDGRPRSRRSTPATSRAA